MLFHLSSRNKEEFNSFSNLSCTDSTGYIILYLIAHTGLPSHPQHEIAKSQCTGFGGMVCFKVKGGKSITRKFMMNLKVIDLQLCYVLRAVSF